MSDSINIATLSSYILAFEGLIVCSQSPKLL
jgi:hypothetical protein